MGKSVALGCIVLVLVGVLVVGGMAAGAYNKLEHGRPGRQRALGTGRERLPAPGRPDSEPRRDRQGRGELRKRHPHAGHPGARVGRSGQARRKLPSRTRPAFEKFQKAQDELGGALSRLLVAVEKYPELKANQNFRDLQTQLEGTENRISVERGRFNDVTQAYNTLRRSFPTVIVANFAGFKERPYFKAAEGSRQTAGREVLTRGTREKRRIRIFLE